MERSFNPIFTVIVICITILLTVNTCTTKRYDKVKSIHQIELKLKVPNEKETIKFFDIELPEGNN